MPTGISLFCGNQPDQRTLDLLSSGRHAPECTPECTSPDPILDGASMNVTVVAAHDLKSALLMRKVSITCGALEANSRLQSESGVLTVVDVVLPVSLPKPASAKSASTGTWQVVESAAKELRIVPPSYPPALSKGPTFFAPLTASLFRVGPTPPTAPRRIEVLVVNASNESAVLRLPSYSDAGCNESVCYFGIELTNLPFTEADVDKAVTIRGDDVMIDNKPRTVKWGDAKHNDCSGIIKTVEEKLWGKVTLDNGNEFENGAGESNSALGGVFRCPATSDSSHCFGDIRASMAIRGPASAVRYVDSCRGYKVGVEDCVDVSIDNAAKDCAYGAGGVCQPCSDLGENGLGASCPGGYVLSVDMT